MNIHSVLSASTSRPTTLLVPNYALASAPAQYDDIDWDMGHWQNAAWKEKTKALTEKPTPVPITLFIVYPKRTALDLNPHFHGDKLVSNSLSYGTNNSSHYCQHLF
jgi:hypothetical protein